MLNRTLKVQIGNQTTRTYVIIKVLKEDARMIKFIGTDANGEVALVVAEKTSEGGKVRGSFDIPVFSVDNYNDDD